MSWHLAGSVATLTRGDFSVRIAIEHPQQGMHIESVRGILAPPLRPLGFTAIPATTNGTELVEEAYVRGDDLIVRYGELRNRDVRPAAEWHDLQPELSMAAIELRLFTQTRWLESHPEIHLTTEYHPAAQLWSWEHDHWQTVEGDRTDITLAKASGAFLIRFSESELTYAEFIYPSDFHEAEHVRQQGTARLKYRFFSEPLEKGVVRVGRVWSAWLPRTDDENEAIRLYHCLCESQLPLTA